MVSCESGSAHTCTVLENHHRLVHCSCSRAKDGQLTCHKLLDENSYLEELWIDSKKLILYIAIE